MTMGDKIRELRIAKGYTLEELGKMIGVRKPTVYKYENSLIVNLKRSIIAKLAKALDTTPDYLMSWDEPNDDNALMRIAEIYKNRPGYQVLFDFATTATPEDLEKAVEYIEFLKGKNRK